MDTTPSITELQEMHENGTIVPFRIVGIGEKGFTARVFNHKAFVSFHFMPFKYGSIEVWKALLPSLKQTGFIGTITILDLEKQFCILNASIPQFESIELDYNAIYTGIIIEKLSSRTIVDLGASFNWKYGSVKGVLPNSKRDRIIYAKDLSIGDSLFVYIYDGDKPHDGDYLVQGSISSRDWESGKVWDLLFKKVTAKVVYHGEEKFFVIDGKYKGELDTSDKWYKKSKLRYAIKSIINNLQEGDEITVEVLRIKESSQTMELKWVIDKRVEEIYLNDTRNTLGDILGNKIDASTFDD